MVDSSWEKHPVEEEERASLVMDWGYKGDDLVVTGKWGE